jgi:peptidyl-prolyl cis-trans isomerase C
MTFLNLPPGFAPRSRVAAFATAAALIFILPAASGCSKDASQESSSKQELPPASDSDKVVARVNGVDIRESDIALAEEDLGAEMQQMPPDQRRDQVITYLADIILVSQAAAQTKLADSIEFKRRLALLRNKVLMGLALQAEVKAALTDEAYRKVYDDATKSMTPQEEVRARHILVETEDEAKAIAEQIKGGADFATLAKEKSKDPGAAEGGDLGYFGKEQMVPEFAEVAFKMFPGQVSNPVKTQFGWHIIKLEDKRQRPVPEFEKVKGQIETFLTRKAQTEYVAKLRQSAKVERLDKPADAKPPADAKAPVEAKPAMEEKKPTEETKPADEKK